MKPMNFESYKEAAEMLVEKAHECDCCAEILTNFETTTEILRELLKMGLSVYSIEYADPEFDCYEDELIISVDKDNLIYIEKAYSENRKRYVISDAECVMMHVGCNKNEILSCHGCAEEVIDFTIGGKDYLGAEVDRKKDKKITILIDDELAMDSYLAEFLKFLFE